MTGIRLDPCAWSSRVLKYSYGFPLISMGRMDFHGSLAGILDNFNGFHWILMDHWNGLWASSLMGSAAVHSDSDNGQSQATKQVLQMLTDKGNGRSQAGKVGTGRSCVLQGFLCSEKILQCLQE